MLTNKYRLERNGNRLSTFAQSTSPPKIGKQSPVGLIVASMLGLIVWLVFILFYALYWSNDFSLFQNIIVFIVSLCITALLIGLMWIIFGPKKYMAWDWNNKDDAQYQVFVVTSIS